MDTVSSTDGSSIITVCRRRSSALSFSIYFRYSASVVAPIACSSPRAREGFRMLAASTEPSAAPAPTSVWISSINRMISPSESCTSFTIALRRSSNSPRNFVPAISAPISRATIRLVFRLSGTSPRLMRSASPSAIAVLPTPGSPISTGLFFVRRERICITRRISWSRPITGSSLFFSACSFRSRAYFFRALYRLSALGSSTFWEPRTSSNTVNTSSLLMPCCFKSRPASLLDSSIPISTCSELIYSSPKLSAELWALSKTSFVSFDKYCPDTEAPFTTGSLSIRCSSSDRSWGTRTPTLLKIVLTTLSASERKASKRWDGSTA